MITWPLVLIRKIAHFLALHYGAELSYTGCVLAFNWDSSGLAVLIANLMVIYHPSLFHFSIGLSLWGP